MLGLVDAYVICKEMGWDWWTLQEQPTHFLDVIRDMINDRAKRQK